MKPREALALLKKYGASPGVIEHVKAVRDYAMEMAEKLDCDPELVEAGALLHDIGRTKTHGIEHAIEGAKILRKEGVDERIVRIVERHVGAGITREEAARLGLPPGDYVPETIEEKIVCQADNLLGSRNRISIHDAIATAEDRWSPDGVKRLIRLQCEVFKPLEVPFEREPGSDGEIEEVIGDLDALYRIDDSRGKTIVSLYGREAEKAARRLKKLYRHP